MADEQIPYLDYDIGIVADGARFKAQVVSKTGLLIEHDGRASQVWVTASCVSRDRALWVAKNAIDTDKVR